MLFAVILFSLVLAIQAAAARVASFSSIDSSDFSARARKNPHFIRNGSAALLDIYAKHDLSSSQHVSPAFNADLNGLQSAHTKRQDGFARAQYRDSQYSIYTQIGGQLLDLQVDTASADFWVFVNQPHRYNFLPDASPTFKNLKVQHGQLFTQMEVTLVGLLALMLSMSVVLLLRSKQSNLPFKLALPSTRARCIKE